LRTTLFPPIFKSGSETLQLVKGLYGDRHMRSDVIRDARQRQLLS